MTGNVSPVGALFTLLTADAGAAADVLLFPPPPPEEEPLCLSTSFQPMEMGDNPYTLKVSPASVFVTTGCSTSPTRKPFISSVNM